MSLVQFLCHLQAVDAEWDEKARLCKSIEQWLSDQSGLESRREAQSRRANKLSAVRSALRNAEFELAGVTEKAKQVEADLYGGRIRSPKELENLRQDSEYLKRRISALEDRVLTTMTETDDLDEATKRGKEELQAFEAEWSKQQKVLVGQYKASRARLQELQALREELRGRLGRGELALYDELRSRKAGLALSPAKEGVCQTCRVTLPSFKARKVEGGESLVTCEGCGRILYQG